MLEPLGVAMHSLRMGPFQPGMDVGVYGCGPIGLMVIRLACLAGAGRIFATDIISQRLELAREMGATDVFMADGSERAAVLGATRKRGVDVSFEVAGQNDAVETAVVTCKPGGCVVVTGITADDRTTFTASAARRKGLTIKIVRRMKHTYPRAIRLVSSGMVDVHSLISHILPFEQYPKAFDLAEKRAGIMVVLDLE
jgi:L-iditol 2-dehydrogenase